MKVLFSAVVLFSILSVVTAHDENNTSNIRRNNSAKQSKGPKAGKSIKGTKAEKAAKAGKSAERAVTLWWALFNKPSECIYPGNDFKCGVKDLMSNGMAGTNTPQISIVHAAGGISDEYGFLRLTSTIYKTKEPSLNLEDGSHYVWGGPPSFYKGSAQGYSPANGEETEVHLVVRDHGPVTENKLDQITTFTDPSCAAKGGPNLCIDVGLVEFQTQEGVITRDIGFFPKFPPGCAKKNECSAEQEAIQLSAGMGNQANLIRTGDALQVVAEITLPKV